MSGPQRRMRGDSGQVGGIEVLPLGFLVFVSVTLLLVNVWGVIDAKFAVTAAARESVRAFAEADTLSVAAATATTRGTATLESFGRSGERAEVRSPVVDSPFGRCVRVSVTVAYTVPALTIPFLGGLGSATEVSSTQSTIVDPFRSGLDGEAVC